MPYARLRRSSLFAAGFLSLGTVLSLLGYGAYSWHKSQIAARNLDLFNSLLPSEALRLEQWKTERTADIAHYVMSPQAVQALSGLAPGRRSPAAAARAASWFETAARAHPSYRRVQVFSPAGALLWSIRPGPGALPGPPWSLPAAGDVSYTDLAIDGGKALVTALARSGALVVAVQIDVAVDPLPSLGSAVTPAAGAFDLYLARKTAAGVEVVDHDPRRPGAVRTYILPLDSAVGRALARGAMEEGPDHFGRLVVAMPAPASWLGWRAVGTREIGAARADSRWLALVFGLLGALAVAGTFLLVARQFRSAEIDVAEAAERLELLTRLHEGLRVCSAACRFASSRDELATEICRILVENAAFKFAAFWEPVDGQRLARYASFGLSPGIALPESLQVQPDDPSGRTATAAAALSGKAVVIDDIGADQRTTQFRAFALAQGARSAMAVPLTGAGQGGVLLVTSQHRGFFRGEASSLIESIAAGFTAACAGFATRERSLRISAELARNKRLLEHIAVALPLGIFIQDMKTRGMVFATPEVAAILGDPLDSPHRFGPSFVQERIHPEDAHKYSAFFETIAGAENGDVFESGGRFRSGECGWKHLRVRGIVFERAATGEPSLILGTMEDVTKAAKAQEALEQSWKDYRRVLQAVECAAESIIITDEKGIIQYINPACERLTGYSKEEAVGHHTRGLKSGVHPPEFYKELWDTITSGRVWTGRLVNKAKDGSFFEEDASIAPVKDEHGTITNFVAVKKDVTKELSLESQLQQSQKLEAVGRLAGGIAHDFNNILTAILGYAHLALGALPEGSSVRDDLAEIEKGARRASDLTRQLLIFSRKQVIKPQVLDPGEVALGLQKMLRRIVGEDVRLRFSSEGGCRILADPGQYEQVVMNFVVNARDAMPKGGDVEVAVRAAALAATAPGVDGPIPPGAYAVLSVRDSGSGIPPDVLPRIFEPFYTTKPAGQGTGLGLSTVYGIVKQGGGYLRVESAPGAGTLMSVFWPVLNATPLPAASTPADAPRGGPESILLVEDEPAILRLAERLLAKAGYRVKAFSEAAAAVDWARSEAGSFDLLFTDVILPGGGGGKDLARTLKAGRPGLRVLYTSGYSAEVVSTHGILDADTRLLAKPFTEEGLLTAVREALDAA